MLEPAFRVQWPMALCLALTSTLVGCVDLDEKEPLDELDDTLEITLPPPGGGSTPTSTTSVCVTKSDGKTVRLDGAGVVSGSSNATNSYVVVPSGATQTDLFSAGQYIFVERGGYTGAIHGAHRIFVAAGGKAAVHLQSKAPTLWVKAGGIVSCGAYPNRWTTIHYEPGAILNNCTATTLIQEPVTHTFRRCPSTTVTNQLAPKANFTLGRNGQMLNAVNKSTGSYSAPRWTVSTSNSTQVKTLYSSTSATGFQFQLPANFDTLYPATYPVSRTATLTIRDPFGLDLYAYRRF